MPTVVIEKNMGTVDPDVVWHIARRLTDYPKIMDQVISVVELGSADLGDTAWTVSFNGNELQWTEVDSFDPDQRRMTFDQVEGDLAEWRGEFTVETRRDATIGRYVVTFDLGVPALATLLHPLAEQSVRSNCQQILEAIAERSGNDGLS